MYIINTQGKLLVKFDPPRSIDAGIYKNLKYWYEMQYGPNRYQAPVAQ